MMTLWCMMRSPLMIGADLPRNDAFTLSLLTNAKVLAIAKDTFCAHQLYRTQNEIAWIAPDKKDSFSNEAVFFFIHINFIRYYVSDIAKQIFATAIRAGNLPASTITIP